MTVSDDEIASIGYSDDDDNSVISNDDLKAEFEEESDDSDTVMGEADEGEDDEIQTVEAPVVEDTLMLDIEQRVQEESINIPDKDLLYVKDLNDKIIEYSNQILAVNEVALVTDAFDAFVNDLSIILPNIKAEFHLKSHSPSLQSDVDLDTLNTNQSKLDESEGAGFCIYFTGRHIVLPPTTSQIDGRDSPLNPVDLMGRGTYSATLLVDLRLLNKETGKSVSISPSSSYSSSSKASNAITKAAAEAGSNLISIGTFPIPLGCKLSMNYNLPPDMKTGVFIINGYPVSMNTQEKMGNNIMIIQDKHYTEARIKTYSNCSTHITSVIAIPISEKITTRSGTMDSIVKVNSIIGHQFHMTFYNTLMRKDAAKKKMPISLNLIHGFRILLSMMLEEIHSARKLLKYKQSSDAVSKFLEIEQLSFLKDMRNNVLAVGGKDIMDMIIQSSSITSDIDGGVDKVSYITTYSTVQVVIHHIIKEIEKVNTKSSHTKQMYTALTKTIELAFAEIGESRDGDAFTDVIIRCESTKRLIDLIRSIFVATKPNYCGEGKKFHTSRFRLIEFPTDSYLFVKNIVKNELMTHVHNNVEIGSIKIPLDHIDKSGNPININPKKLLEAKQHISTACMYYRRAVELGRLFRDSMNAIGSKGSDKDNVKDKSYESIYSLNRALLIESVSDMFRSIILSLSDGKGGQTHIGSSNYRDDKTVTQSLAVQIAKGIAARNITFYNNTSIKTGKWGQKNIQNKDSSITEYIKSSESRMATIQSVSKISIPTGGSGAMHEARLIHPSQQSSISSLTPDGTKSGLKKYPAPLTLITTYVSPKSIIDKLLDHTTDPDHNSISMTYSNINCITLHINSDWLGYISEETAKYCKLLKRERQYRYMSYIYVGRSLYLYTTEGRLVNPFYVLKEINRELILLFDSEVSIKGKTVIPSHLCRSLADINPFSINNLVSRAGNAKRAGSYMYSMLYDQLPGTPTLDEMIEAGVIEYLDHNEIDSVSFENIVPDVFELYIEKRSGSYMHISPAFTEALSACCLPSAAHTYGSRVGFAALQSRARPGQSYISDIRKRRDKEIVMLTHPQAPLTRTRTADACHLNDLYLTGQNVTCAIMSYTSFDIEDAITISKSSLERLMMTTHVYGTITVKSSTLSAVSMPNNLSRKQIKQYRKLAIRQSDAAVAGQKVSYPGIIACDHLTDTIGSTNSFESKHSTNNTEDSNQHQLRLYLNNRYLANDYNSKISVYRAKLDSLENEVNIDRDDPRIIKLNSNIAKLTTKLNIVKEASARAFSKIKWDDSDIVSPLGAVHTNKQSEKPGTMKVISNKTKLTEGDIVGIEILNGSVVSTTKFTDWADGFVEDVCRPQRLSTNDKPVTLIMFTTLHQLSEGDKVTSDQAQKTTLGLIYPQENMPFTESGVSIDVIMNPTAFPTRNTISQLIDMSLGVNACSVKRRVGTLIRSKIDFLTHDTRVPFSSLNVEETKEYITYYVDTPVPLRDIIDDKARNDLKQFEQYIYNMCYTDFGRHTDVSDIMEVSKQLGLDVFCTEPLYNGETGELIESDIISGVINLALLKQIACKKFTCRDKGPKDLLTGQSTHGRRHAGSQRAGKQEIDALISHNLVRTLHNRLCKYSDEILVTICRRCERIVGVNSQICLLCKRFGNNAELYLCKMPFSLVLLSHFMNAISADLLVKTEVIPKIKDEPLFEEDIAESMAHFLMQHNVKLEMPETDYLNTITEVMSKTVESELHHSAQEINEFIASNINLPEAYFSGDINFEYQNFEPDY